EERPRRVVGDVGDRVVRGERHVRPGAAEQRGALRAPGRSDRGLRGRVELPERLWDDGAQPSLGTLDVAEAAERVVPRGLRGDAGDVGVELVREYTHGVRSGRRAADGEADPPDRDDAVLLERGGRRPR